MSEQPAAPPRIGVWGFCDSGDAAGVALPAIVLAELSRRLPGATLRLFAPLGRSHPVPRDGGRTSSALADDAAGLDCLVIAAPRPPEHAYPAEVDPLGALLAAVELAPATTVVWLAAQLDPEAAPFPAGEAPARLTAVDQATRDVLAEAFPGHDVELVPDPLLLLPRLLGDELLNRRAALMRMLGWLPTGGRFVVVDASVGEPARQAVLSAAAAAGMGVVLIDPRGDASSATGLPPQAGIEDLSAAIRAAAGVVAETAFSAAAAEAFGVPTLSDPARVGEWITAIASGSVPPPAASAAIPLLDAELDLVADLAWPDRAAQPTAAPHTHAAAHLHRQRRELLTEIGTLQARLLEAERQRHSEVVTLTAEAGHWRAEAIRWQDVAERVLTSKTWRYTEPARALYRRLRSRGDQ